MKARRWLVVGQLRRRRREQNLPAVRGRHDARDPVFGVRDGILVTCRVECGITAVQPHAHHQRPQLFHCAACSARWPSTAACKAWLTVGKTA
jgi:hypothetical protein